MKKYLYIFKKIRDVGVRDIIAVFPMIIAKVIAHFDKKYKDTWLICEDASEARDNGYFFFKYMVENHPEMKCIYAIKTDAPDYEKVKVLGETIPFGSLKHWIVYFECKYNISSQKGGKPNAAVCAFCELISKSSVKNVFLQHGVTINNARWLYSDVSSIDYFITATTDETNYIRDNFGYNDSVIKQTGFPRFDNLHNFNNEEKRILIMPTWRAWFSEKTAQKEKGDSIFETSDYLIRWKEFLKSDSLAELSKKYNLEMIFYPHRNMQKYLHYFKSVNDYVTIASSQEYDVQALLKTSRLLITDYSSVFFDMIYMKKPIIFYQFDEEKYRAQQYKQGYFDYHNNPFGKVVNSTEEVIEELTEIIQNNFAISEHYRAEHERLFPLFDINNSERIYEVLCNE